MSRPSVGSRGWRRALAASIAAAFLGVQLSGCSIIEDYVPPGTFDYVNEAAAELELDTVGEFQAEGGYGGSWFMGDGPTYVAVISGEDAPEIITERLLELGYEHVGGIENIESWERGSDEKWLTVRVITVQPGDLATIHDGEEIVVEQEGAQIAIIGAN